MFYLHLLHFVYHLQILLPMMTILQILKKKPFNYLNKYNNQLITIEEFNAFKKYEILKNKEFF